MKNSLTIKFGTSFLNDEIRTEKEKIETSVKEISLDGYSDCIGNVDGDLFTSTYGNRGFYEHSKSADGTKKNTLIYQYKNYSKINKDKSNYIEIKDDRTVEDSYLEGYHMFNMSQMEETVRNIIEKYDRLDNILIISNTNGLFGGITHKMLNYIEEEYNKKLLVSIALSYNKVDNVLPMYHLAKESDLLLPWKCYDQNFEDIESINNKEIEYLETVDTKKSEMIDNKKIESINNKKLYNNTIEYIERWMNFDKNIEEKINKMKLTTRTTLCVTEITGEDGRRVDIAREYKKDNEILYRKIEDNYMRLSLSNYWTNYLTTISKSKCFDYDDQEDFNSIINDYASISKT
eukprot:GHVP01061407.1.p1 GENE.GHVP01061407.1~~GHVP01061407.1.p1  ORF type:complete len:347 (+),score=54.30 GHVP01061407.1:1127-2167(+)